MEILSNLGYTVKRIACDIDETPLPNEAAENYVRRMAEEKNRQALAMLGRHSHPQPDAPVLTADTVVVADGKILGKPQSEQHAESMLAMLSGQTHQVMTAVCIHFRGNTQSMVQTNHVTFRRLSAEEITAYIRSGEPMDKAGAYGIQGIGGIFVETMTGSFTGVMGLPVAETVALLQKLAYPVPPFIHTA